MCISRLAPTSRSNAQRKTIRSTSNLAFDDAKSKQTSHILSFKRDRKKVSREKSGKAILEHIDIHVCEVN